MRQRGERVDADRRRDDLEVQRLEPASRADGVALRHVELGVVDLEACAGLVRTVLAVLQVLEGRAQACSQHGERGVGRFTMTRLDQGDVAG